MSLQPRVVVVHRRTGYTELLRRHGTAGQAGFFLRERGVDISGLEQEHHRTRAALTRVAAAIPVTWRRGTVERDDLPTFLFGPEDIVVVVGQDGLVPNLAKYLTGQVVIGIRIEPQSGVLVRHTVSEAGELLLAGAAGTLTVEQRTMVAATADDGQTLLALNEIYLGHRTHQTARYTLHAAEGTERQASSGVLVSTGTGATGWCRSVWLERGCPLALPGPTSRSLGWFVREAWPSPGTGTGCTEGLVTDSPLRIRVESDELVAFGDGMESDAIALSRGQQVSLGLADRTLNLAC